MTTRLVRGLRRPAARAVVAAVIALSVAVVALWWSAARPGPPAPSTDAVRVGVTPGGSIPEYAESSRRDLAAYRGGETYALVTFATYLEPARLAAALRGVTPVEVVIRVPLPDAQTEIVRLPVLRVPEDVLAGLDRVAARKEAEADEYRRRAAESDPARRAGHEVDARVAAAEAAAMRQRVACAYASLVRGTGDAFAALATRPEIRVVDPAPEVTDPARTVVLPPLPEQSDFARPPSGR